MFDPARPPATPIAAASVILLREAAGGPEVFLLRRHRRSGFMANAYVFPGGKVDPTDASPEHAAVRELFEEAGVLLCRGAPHPEHLADWRRRLEADGLSFDKLCLAEQVTLETGALHFWSRWITPSAEPKRFDALFFVAELPPGQVPSFDKKETVDELWITPRDAVARQAAGDLVLPPPQLKTMTELAEAGDIGGIRRASAARLASPHPMLPRFAEVNGKIALLLPWDPDYQSQGKGEGAPIDPSHILARGPSRFVLEGMSWSLTFASGSPNAVSG